MSRNLPYAGKIGKGIETRENGSENRGEVKQNYLLLCLVWVENKNGKANSLDFSLSLI